MSTIPNTCNINAPDAKISRIHFSATTTTPRVDDATRLSNFESAAIKSLTLDQRVSRRYNLTRWSEFPRCGQFAAAEEPALLATDIRSFVAGLG